MHYSLPDKLLPRLIVQRLYPAPRVHLRRDHGVGAVHAEHLPHTAHAVKIALSHLDKVGPLQGADDAVLGVKEGEGGGEEDGAHLGVVEPRREGLGAEGDVRDGTGGGAVGRR